MGILSKYLEKENFKYCLCKNKVDETLHLFECKETINGCVLKSRLSICKKEKLENLSSNYECIVRCENIEETRLKLAELANDGYQICGICVSRLYKNEGI